MGKGFFLQIYRVVEISVPSTATSNSSSTSDKSNNNNNDNNNNNNNKATNNEETKGEQTTTITTTTNKSYLELILEKKLCGNITSMEKVKFRGRSTHSLMLSFKDAKVYTHVDR